MDIPPIFDTNLSSVRELLHQLHLPGHGATDIRLAVRAVSPSLERRHLNLAPPK
jgi:hypothetical protein